MKFLFIVLIVVAVVALRIVLYRRRRLGSAQRPAADGTDDGRPVRRPESRPPHRTRRWRGGALEMALGDVGLVASREIKERIRGRILRVGTLIVLIFVAAAIVIPTLHHGGGPSTQTVGVIGRLSPETDRVVYAAGSSNHDAIKLVGEASLAVAKADLRSGKVDFTIVDDDEILLNEPATASSSPADPGLVDDVAEYLGVLKSYQAAGLSPAQAQKVEQAKSLPVHTLSPSSKSAATTPWVIGLVLLFFMLSQYCTWILIGVMQEKSSRVVEVLLATVRPIQLLGGKVLGIGLLALGQATLIVGVALLVGAAVGSDLLRGAAPLVLVCQLLWLVLGYAFYCWLYAAAGSTAERQDQVQTLAVPLSIPILLGYIFSLTVASSGTPDLFYKILAYLPPTAPFCMPVLVGLSQVTWWQFLASVLITLVCTVGMAVFAARIYRRAVLRTGGRVHLRELLAGGAR